MTPVFLGGGDSWCSTHSFYCTGEWGGAASGELGVWRNGRRGVSGGWSWSGEKVGGGVGIDMWKESRYERCLSVGLKMLLRGVKRVIESSSAIVRLPEK